MDLLLILLVVGGPVLIIVALVWSASLRGPAPRATLRGDSGNVPERIPDEYRYERRMEEERSSGEHGAPEEHRK